MQNIGLDCFGNLDKVFPLTRDGLRRSSKECVACDRKVRCLKAAVSSENQAMIEEEKVDRAYKSGRISFFERWSKKKILHNRRTEYGHGMRERFPGPE